MLEIMILVICVGVLLIGNAARKETDDVFARLNRTLTTLPPDAASHIHYAPDRRHAWAIDPIANVLYALKPDSSGIRVTSIPASAIISAEVYEDGDAVTSRSTTRTIGGAIVGGALAGGAGVVVGGLSGGSRTRSTVRIIELRVTVNDMAQPLIAIPFLIGEVARDTAAYADASKTAREWHGRISILSQRADGQERTTVRSSFVRDAIPSSAMSRPADPALAAKMARARALAAQRKQAEIPGENRIDPE